MTPRILLTTIGAAAFAFAVIIGAAATLGQHAAPTAQAQLVAASTATLQVQRPAWDDDWVIPV